MTQPTLSPPALALPQSDRRVLLPWYAAEFCNSYATALLTYCCYFLAKDYLQAAPASCLWLSAAWGVGVMIFALLAGVLSNRLGPRRMILFMCAGSIGTALVGLLAIACHNYWLLMLGMFAYNSTSTQIWPALEAAITRSPARLSLAHRVTTYNLVWSSGNFAAMFSSGLIMSLGWSAIFIVPSCASLVGFLIVRFAAIRAGQIADHAVHEAHAAVIAPERATRLLHMAWIANAMGYVAINTLLPVLPTLTEKLARGSPAAGSIWGFARVAGFLLFAVWAGWQYRARYLVAALAIMTVAFALLLTVPSFSMLVFSQLAMGLMTAFVYASSLYYAMHVSRGGSGHAGIHEALIGVGVAIGPAVGAAVGTGADALPRVAIGVTTVLAAGVFVLAVLARRKTIPPPLQSVS